MNKILPYLSQVHHVVKCLVDDMDIRLSDTDDGEKHSVDEGRKAGLDAIEHCVEQLEKLKKEIRDSSYATFVSNNDMEEYE